jgi:hypothetical protein
MNTIIVSYSVDDQSFSWCEANSKVPLQVMIARSISTTFSPEKIQKPSYTQLIAYLLRILQVAKKIHLLPFHCIAIYLEAGSFRLGD